MNILCRWFYQEGRGYRSLAEMVSIYHDSVGHGGNMLLNVAPPPYSTIPQVAMDIYAALGSFIRNCYGEGSLPSSSSALQHHELRCEQHNECCAVVPWWWDGNV